MQDLKEHCDIEIKWHVNYRCNFRCPYCFSMSNWKNPQKFRDIDEVVDSFNRLGLTCHIFLTGGEPFLFPNFIDLCKKLTKHHIISIVTNLSHKDVYRFIEEIDPGRVRFIICNIHLQERLRLNLMEDYIKKYCLLKDKGFFLVADYVTHPPLIKRLVRDYAFFKSKGIIISIKIYRGPHMKLSILKHPRLRKLKNYFSRKYPEAYTAKEKAIMNKLIDESLMDQDMRIPPDAHKLGGRFPNRLLEKCFLDEVPTFKGNECTVGSEFVKMDPEGKVNICYSGKDHCLGNMFEGGIKLLDKPIICPYDVCKCFKLGSRYSKSKNIQECPPPVSGHKG